MVAACYSSGGHFLNKTIITRGDYVWKKNIEVVPLSFTFNNVLSIAASKCRHTEPKEGEAYRRLISSIVNNDEGSVIEHAVITYDIKGISRVTLAQLTRHRIASYTVESQRYVKRSGNYNLAFLDEKKYSGLQKWIVEKYIWLGYILYNVLIDRFGWRKDHARYIIPQADICDLVATFNLRSLRNFFKQRLSQKAQLEIRYLAWKMFIIAHNIYPEVFDDMKEYRTLFKE
jgi:thymidylate synthase (FAD)